MNQDLLRKYEMFQMCWTTLASVAVTGLDWCTFWLCWCFIETNVKTQDCHWVSRVLICSSGFVVSKGHLTGRRSRFCFFSLDNKSKYGKKNFLICYTRSHLIFYRRKRNCYFNRPMMKVREGRDTTGAPGSKAGILKGPLVVVVVVRGNTFFWEIKVFINKSSGCEAEVGLK